MPVEIPLVTKLDVAAAEAAARAVKNLFSRTGREISAEYERVGSGLLGAFDTSKFAAQQEAMRAEIAKTARAEQDAARLAIRADAEVEASKRRLAEVTAKYGEQSSQAAKAAGIYADKQALAKQANRESADAAVVAAAAANKVTDSHKGLAESTRLSTVATAASVTAVGAMAVAFGSGVKAAGDFQQAQNKLVSAADMSKQSVKDLSDGVLKLAGNVGISAQELMSNSFQISKMGFKDAGENLKVLTAAAEGSKVEGADLKEVINALTISLHDYNIPADQAVDVMSKLKVAAGEAGVPLQEFSGALHSVEPLASAIGIKMADLYGALAEVTKSGTSADQATQNMANSLRAMTDAQGPARKELEKWGISAQDISAKLGDRGLAGTYQYIADTIHQKMGGATEFNTGALVKNGQALENLKQMMQSMSPEAAGLAQKLEDGTIHVKDFVKAARGMNVKDFAQSKDFLALIQQVDGFTSSSKNAQSALETFDQAFKRATGGAQSLNVGLQLIDEKGQQANDIIKKISDTNSQVWPDGQKHVAGFKDAMDGYNAKLDQTKAGFNALKIELGNEMLPVLTEFAHGMSDVAGYFVEHKGQLEALITTMGVLGTVWLGYKAITSQTAQDAVKALKWIGTQTGLLKDQTIRDSAESSGKQIADQAKVTEAAGATNKALGSGRAAAAAEGAVGVKNAATEEVLAENNVRNAALEADGAMSGGGGAAPGNGGKGGFMRGLAKGALALPLVQTVYDMGQGLQDSLKGVPGVDQSQDLWHRFTGGGHANGGIVGFADGGVLPGYSPGVDNMMGMLNGKPIGLAGGEGILVPEVVRALGPNFVNSLNRQFGGHRGAGMVGYASGGITGQEFDAELLSYVPAGRYSQTGAADLTKGLADCSSAVEDLVNIMDGRSTAGRQMSTANEAQWLTAHGFLPGMGGPGDFRVGFNSEHTQATLPGGTPFNWGSDAAAARRGIGGTGADDPAFTQHYYRPMGYGDDQRLFAAQERVAKLEDRIAVLQQRISEETTKTKQSEKDKLDRELERAKEELEHAKGQLAEIEASPGGSRGRRGSRGSQSLAGGFTPQFGAPLPANFGLDKGLSGLVEWGLTALADLAIGPIEGAMYGDMLRSGQLGDMLGAPGGSVDVADALDIPTTSLAGDFTPPGGGSAPIGGSAGGSGTGGSRASGGGSSGGVSGGYWWNPGAGAKSGSSYWWAPGSAPAPAPAAAPPGPFSYKNPDGSYPPGFIGPHLIDPARSLSEGDIAGVHGSSLTPGAQQFPPFMNAHIAPPDAPLAPYPSAIPKTASGGIDYDAIRRGLPQGPLNMTNRPAPTGADYKNWYGQQPEYHADGGPVGTDTVPSWLTKGEFVVNADATRHNMHQLQSINAHHYADGGLVDDTENGSRQPSAAQSSSGGLDVGGGSLGMAEAAGAMALNGLAPGAGAGAQIAMSEMNRGIKYGAQLGGIFAQGLLETFALNDSVIGDPSKSWIGRFGAGLAGAHPSSPNSAGKTQPPLRQASHHEEGKSQHLGTGAPPGPGGTGGPLIGTVNMGNNGDPHAAAREINRQVQAYPSMGGR